MNDELFERVLVQLHPELAQEFGYAILEDRKKLKAFEFIKKLFGFEIEDYDENNHGSIKVKEQRIILDDEEIDLLKEVLK